MSMAGAAIGETLRQIGRLFDRGAVAGQSDAALLRRFVTGRDEDAFAGLVARHGPMVLAVCRGVLRDPSDAEDAFQATFLVLVRRAGSLWVDESLGGWLYRVAHRVAVRANRDAARRRARERRGVEMDAIAGKDAGSADRPEAALHAEIARLPESYRRALVLCELEGLTQVEAARALHCGEATLRRRLAGARERLRARLGSGATALAMPSAVPAGWAEATVRAAVAAGRVASAAGRLAASVAGSMIRARRLRVAAMLIAGAGLASALAIAAGRDDPRGPAVVQAPTPKADAPAAISKPQPHWVHVKYDTDYERWVCLDDGRRLSKTDEVAVLEDPAAGTEMRWDLGEQRITRREAFRMAGGKRPDPSALREMMTREFEYPAIDKQPSKTPVVGPNWAEGSLESTPETIDGRRCLRLDQFMNDPSGGPRLEKQTWVDLETKRPIRVRERLVLSHQIKFKKEFRVGTYEYADTGPADLVALGFPKGLPIIDARPPRPEALPEGIRRALEGASAAIRRLPRDLRVVTEGQGQLALIYWSCPEPFLRELAEHVIDQEDQGYQIVQRPRLSVIDRGEFDEVGDDHRPAIPPAPGGDALAGLSDAKLASIFSRRAATNIRLDDGRWAVDVDKGGVVEPGKPPGDLVLVRDGFPEPPGLPGPIAEQWPFAKWDRRSVMPVDPEPGTPPGQVVLQMEVQGMRHRWYCDPGRDFIAVRQVESYQKDGEWKVSEDSRAVRWKPLPGGAWYVAEWEVLGGGEDAKSTRRVEVTPLAPDGFPPGLFDSNKLIEDFKKAGAQVLVD